MLGTKWVPFGRAASTLSHHSAVLPAPQNLFVCMRSYLWIVGFNFLYCGTLKKHIPVSISQSIYTLLSSTRIHTNYILYCIYYNILYLYYILHTYIHILHTYRSWVLCGVQEEGLFLFSTRWKPGFQVLFLDDTVFSSMCNFGVFVKNQLALFAGTNQGTLF